MKTERRHELKQNELGHWIDETMDRMAPYMRSIVGTLVALVLLVIAVLFWTKNAKDREQRSWVSIQSLLQSVTGSSGNEEREKALEELNGALDEYAGSKAAIYGTHALAEFQLQEGMSGLFSSRSSAEKNLSDAVGSFESVLQQTNDPRIVQRATLGLAHAYEARNRLDDAIEQYQKISEKWPDSEAGREAKRRLADLEGEETKDFYDWFAQADRNSPLGSGLLDGLGSGPNFDDESGLTEPEEDSKGESDSKSSLKLNPANEEEDSATKNPDKQADAKTQDKANSETTKSSSKAEGKGKESSDSDRSDAADSKKSPEETTPPAENGDSDKEPGSEP